MESDQSWGRWPRAVHRETVAVRWRDEPPDLARLQGPLLPRGWGRSYGDACLNDGGVLLDARPLDRFIAFDAERGILRCEAGVTLAEILDLVLPNGWFPPVLPGTRWVSVGGAIANDIHGKNHHQAGTFGRHVTRLALLRSDGPPRVCAADEDGDLYRATIGGLGLTGLILWAEIRLRRVEGPRIAADRRPFRDLAEFFALAAEDASYEHAVAWVDCLGAGGRAGRGVYLRGNHVAGPLPTRRAADPPALRIPVTAPPGLLNRFTAKAFNALYHADARRRRGRRIESYAPFFFPLDAVGEWNRLYGPCGFLQYQCVVPDEGEGGSIRAILDRIRRSGEPSFLAVLKRFADLPSPGLLSFPRPGLTLALDFPMRGSSTLRLLDELDAVVVDAGGAVYPAKDARMSAATFQRSFPGLAAFLPHLDPRFSSSFWRRVAPARTGA